MSRCRFMKLWVPATLSVILALACTTLAATCRQIRSKPDKWVDRRVTSLVVAAREAYDGDDEDTDTDAYNRVLGQIVRVLDVCHLSEDEAFATRYKDLLDYVGEASYGLKPGHSMGFNVTDKEYFSEVLPMVTIPDYLLEPTFMRNVSRYETLGRAKAYLTALNAERPADRQLTFFSYISQHLGTPDNDNSFRRLLIVVPGDPQNGVPERWVQFGVSDPGQRVRTRNMSVVSASLSDNGTYNAYFKDYFRTFHRDGSITYKGRLESGNGDENCATCHKSGILPIFPKPGSVPRDELPMVDVVNERFRSYGTPRFDKFLDAAKFGPGVSSANWEDRIRRFGEHFGETETAQAMSCSKCHNADGLGSLNWPMDSTILSSFVNGGQMPRDHGLSPAERHEVYDKLIDEYFSPSDTQPGILKAWLLGRTRQDS